MAVVRVQTAKTVSGTGATIAVNITPTAGNFLVAFIGYETATAITVSGVSDTVNGAWTLLTGMYDEVPKGIIAYRENVSAGARTITATFSGGSPDESHIIVHEYSGVALSSSFDAQAAGSSIVGGTTTTLSTANMAVTDGGLLFCGAKAFVGGTFTAGSSNGQSWVKVEEPAAAVMTEEMLNKPPGTYAGAATFSTTNYAMCAAAFKAVAAIPDLSALIGEPIVGYSALS